MFRGSGASSWGLGVNGSKLFGAKLPRSQLPFSTGSARLSTPTPKPELRRPWNPRTIPAPRALLARVPAPEPATRHREHQGFLHDPSPRAINPSYTQPNKTLQNGTLSLNFEALMSPWERLCVGFPPPVQRHVSLVGGCGSLLMHCCPHAKNPLTETTALLTLNPPVGKSQNNPAPNPKPTSHPQAQGRMTKLGNETAPLRAPDLVRVCNVLPLRPHTSKSERSLQAQLK